MILKEKNKVNTDQAWSLLYNRFEKEGLLPDKTKERPAQLIRSPFILWAAAIALFCISTATILFIQNNDSNVNSNLLTLQNEKGAATLVTTLEDGSVVYLANNAQLQYPEHFSKEKREVTLKGNALFDVTGNKERPFLIETEEISIEVIGTAFNVQSTDRIPFELSVQRGEVRVTYKKSGENLHVKAGETVKLSSGQLQLRQTENKKTFSRFTEQIRFKDERLGDIINIINKQSSDILLQTIPSLEDRQLTVTFDNNSPEVVAELICTAFNLKYKKENNILLISEP